MRTRQAGALVASLSCIIAIAALAAWQWQEPTAHAATTQPAKKKADKSAKDKHEHDKHEHGKHAKDSLHERMEAMGDLMKKLGKAIRDKELDKAAAVVHEMQGHLHHAKLMQPHEAEELKGEKKAEFLKEFRLEMIAAVKELLDLETALLKGDHAAADRELKEVVTHMKHAHDEFRKEDH